MLRVALAVIMPLMAQKRRRPMVNEDLERVVTMLPKSDLSELDKAAEHEGLSRSALLRTIVKRYLRAREG